MDYIISTVLATAPNGFWENIIMTFENTFLSFALSIVVLTVIIKLVMSPLDFLNRRTSNKMAQTQARIKPQVDAIEKKYSKDPNLKNQKLGELYKKEKVNPMGSCVVMLVNLVLTLTIFITLLNGMNAMASYKIADQFDQLQIEYISEIAGERLDLDQPDKSVIEIVLPYIQEINALTDEDQKQQIIDNANQRVAQKFQETKESFLWIDNIWLADSPFKNSIPSFEEYADVARLTKEERENQELKDVYDQIMSPLSQTQGRANGYFVLVVLCALTAFLNQFLMTRLGKKKNQVQSNKLMLIIMPLIFAVFTFLYSTMFTLYLITGQIVGILLTPLINVINDAIDKHQENKKIPTDRLKRI